MKLSYNVLAAVLLGFAHQVFADDIYCFDEGLTDSFEFDATGFEYKIHDICYEKLDESPVVYEVTDADGSELNIEVSASAFDEEGPEQCQYVLTNIVNTCMEEKSDGDATHFRGGYWNEADWSASIQCEGCGIPQ